MTTNEVTWKEAALIAVLLVAIGAVQLTLARAAGLFHADFWLDEIYTTYIVDEPDLTRALQGLRNAVDTNPPTLHLLLRGWTALWGNDETAYRSFALLAMYLAMLGVYLVLRGLFPPLSSLAGTLAVWCHPLIIRHAFEARFYGPWLAGVAWYTFFLARSLGEPGRWRWRLGVAVASVFLCTIHYFGIFTFGLVTISVVGWRRDLGWRLVPGLVAASLGPFALATCLPFFLGQRAALTIGTWIEPLDATGIMIGLAPLWAVFCLYYLRQLLAKYLPPHGDGSGVLGLLSLALLTPVLTLFSVLVQPATMARYILPSLAALAPLAAFFAYRLKEWGGAALCGLFFALGIVSMHSLAEHYRARDEKTANLIAAIRRLPEDVPVAFEFTDALCVVDYYAPDLRFRCFYLDFEREDLPASSNHRIVTRDVARQIARYRGHPGLMNWRVFRNLPRRFVVPADEDWEKPLEDADRRFPGFRMVERAPRLIDLVTE